LYIMIYVYMYLFFYIYSYMKNFFPGYFKYFFSAIISFMPANSRNRSKSNLLNRLTKNYYEKLLGFISGSAHLPDVIFRI